MQGAPIPSRPYLYRALLEWVIDNGWTPHVVVDATDPDAQVPNGFVQDGRITLNVAPSAVRDYHQDADAISFAARFAGQSHSIYAPMRSVLAVFARETGQGMMFGAEPGHETLNKPDESAAASVLQAIDPQRPSSAPGHDLDPASVEPPVSSATAPATKRNGPKQNSGESSGGDPAGAPAKPGHESPAAKAPGRHRPPPEDPGSGPKSRRARFTVVK